MKNLSKIEIGAHKRLFTTGASLLAISLAILLSSCSTPLQTTRQQVSTSLGTSDGPLSTQINRDINSYRASKGLPAVERHRGLDAIAQRHAEYLASKIGNGGLTANSANHDGFDGRVVMARRLYRIRIGENVVISSNHSSKHLVKLLAGSKSHDQNMRDKWKYIGVGVATSQGGFVVSTQEFGGIEASERSEM